MSVDTPDAKPDSEPEDLTINDMESVVEIVMEEFLKIDNAIAEHDEPDEDDKPGFEAKKEVSFYVSPKFNLLIQLPHNHTNAETPYNSALISDYSSDIVPPPPKA
ncbi:MAG: hypothetical protein WAQ28_10660 [Bacteroidia bacterium]